MWKTLLLASIVMMPAHQAAGQRRGIELTYGKWWHNGGTGDVITASLTRHWFGPFSWGIGVNHLNDGRSLVDRSVTGAEMSLRVGSQYEGPYLVGAAGVGMTHHQSNLDAQWSLGTGYAYSPSSVFMLYGEARYRAEDQQMRGFWALDPGDRTGLMLSAGLALRFGGSGVRRPSRSPRRPPVRRDQPEPAHGAPADVDESEGNGANRPALATVARLPRYDAALASNVVETALDVMGSPYRWGGRDDNGFDCSGLIQYAYAEHGIIVPRVSRDQASFGEYIEPKVEKLRPGDVLGFAISGGRVSHVGLYVGDGFFIHSSSTGVRLSSLIEQDSHSLYYQRRWVVARRVLN